MLHSPVFLALCATLFTWGMTALGAALVFLFKEVKLHILNMMLGFASGVMIAASFWSLLAPAIEMAQNRNVPPWFMVASGFLCGAFFLWLADKLMPHMHMSTSGQEYLDGPMSSWKRSVLLVLSITLHNIPEGLAVGVAFGGIASKGNSITLASAVAVAIGIGLQNLPEGAAVSIPLRREGVSRRKSFFYGQISGVVEPIAGVIGAILVVAMEAILSFALSFAAGAMIFVVVEELIPSVQTGGNEETDLATVGCILGFVVMMILDVALG